MGEGYTKVASSWPGMGVPPSLPDKGYPLILTIRKNGVPPSARWGYLPQNVDRQTPVKTVPSQFVRNAGGNKVRPVKKKNKTKNSCVSVKVYWILHNSGTLPSQQIFFVFIFFHKCKNTCVSTLLGVGVGILSYDKSQIWWIVLVSIKFWLSTALCWWEVLNHIVGISRYWNWE